MKRRDFLLSAIAAGCSDMRYSTVSRTSTVTQVVLMPCASNMVTGVVSELSSASLASQWDINEYNDHTGAGTEFQWTQLKSPAITGGFGAELTLGRALKDGGRNIAVHKQERNATSWATDWYGPGAPAYDELVTALPARLALLGTPTLVVACCVDILHLDAIFLAYANAVQANITTFRAALRAFLGLPNLLFIFDNFADVTAAGLPYSAQAEAGLLAAIAADPMPGRSLLNDCSLYPTGSTIQPNHFTTAAMETCGNSWATKVLANA